MNCALLGYQNNLFLLPMLAIAELISIKNIEDVEFNENGSTVLGEYRWQQINLPVIAIDLASLPASIIHPKLAILHVTFSNSQVDLAYVAVIFEGTPKRLKIHSEQLVWSDEKSKRAILHLAEDLEVTIFDLNRLSQVLEPLLIQRNGDTQIAK